MDQGHGFDFTVYVNREGTADILFATDANKDNPLLEESASDANKENQSLETFLKEELPTWGDLDECADRMKKMLKHVGRRLRLRGTIFLITNKFINIKQMIIPQMSLGLRNQMHLKSGRLHLNSRGSRPRNVMQSTFVCKDSTS